MQEKIGFLSKFLGYELQSAERYRRFVSVVMVSSKDGNGNGKVQKMLLDTLRNSDVMADFDGAAIILMSETNSAGAISAIERYKSKNTDHDLRFSVVTYPADGGGPEGIIAAAFRRLQKALGGQPGSVVMTG